MPAEFKKRIPLEEALSLIGGFKASPTPIALQPERAIGLFCAEEVRCRTSVPALPVSMVDGYAVSTTDKNEFIVTRQLGPGETSPMEIPPEHALKVSTGAYLPKNAKCVVPLENVRVEGYSILVESFPNETNIMPAGFDCERNEVICSVGDMITPKKAFFMKWAGIQAIKALPRPRVSIIPIGSELVDGVIPNTNYIILSSIVDEIGASPRVAQPVPDDVKAISEAITSELNESDVIITTGGSSVGEKDLVIDAIGLLNGRVLFHGLKLKPGRTGGVAEVNGKPLIITSGNIQASAIETLLLLSRSLASMGYPVSVKKAYAKVDNDVRVDGPEDFSYVIWVKLYNIQNETFARCIESLSTSRRIIEKADGFAIIKGNYLKKNTVVEVLLL